MSILSTTGPSLSSGSMITALSVLYVLLGVLILGSIMLTVLFKKRKAVHGFNKILLGMCYTVTFAVLVCTVLCVKKSDEMRDHLGTPPSTAVASPSETDPAPPPTDTGT